MAISVDWPNKVIHVPKADLTPVYSTLFELDVAQFKVELAALSSSFEGMINDRIFTHNTSVVMAGITYSRFVEIINGYSVEFEDGAYSVRLVGANNNVFDIQSGVLIQNQVQVIPTNSAGLQTVATGTGGLTKESIAEEVWARNL